MIRIRSIFEARNRAIGFDEESVDHVLMLSTEDILSTKSLIMCIYRPIGILKTKFQCIVHIHEQKYIAEVFKLKDENSKTKRRLNQPSKPINSSSDGIDKQQNHEFLILMPNVRKRRSLFQIGIDSDAIKIDIIDDEKLCGSLILSSKDLQKLDLPNLHSSISSCLIAADYHILTRNSQYDFDQSSNAIYKSCTTSQVDDYGLRIRL